MILGSSSLDDIIARLDAIERVSSQDAQILRTVKRYRKEVETRRSNLEKARTSQAQIVEDRAAEKQSIESQLAEQNRLLVFGQGRDRADARGRGAQAGRARRSGAGSARKLRRLAQQAQQDTADQAYTPELRGPDVRPEPARGPVRRRRRDRAAVLGRPVRLGRLEPVDRIRLLGLRRATSLRRSASTCPITRRRSTAMGTAVPYDQLAPGDLVFFSGLGHVGIYIGGGQFVHAPHTGDVVRISSLAEHGSYVGARRL